MSDLSGRCLCGRIKFSTPGPILWSGICHCDSCRRATASPCTAFFGVTRDSIQWTGHPAVHETSGGTVQRLYCKDCGTQIAYRADFWPDENHFYMANLANPEAVKPQAHYHWGEKLSWLAINDDLPKYDTSSEAGDPL